MSGSTFDAARLHCRVAPFSQRSSTRGRFGAPGPSWLRFPQRAVVVVAVSCRTWARRPAARPARRVPSRGGAADRPLYFRHAWRAIACSTPGGIAKELAARAARTDRRNRGQLRAGARFALARPFAASHRPDIPASRSRARLSSPATPARSAWRARPTSHDGGECRMLASAPRQRGVAG